MRKIKEVLRLRFELQLGQRKPRRPGSVGHYRKIGTKNASKKRSSVIAIPSNGGNAPFPTFLRSTSSSSNIAI